MEPVPLTEHENVDEIPNSVERKQLQELLDQKSERQNKKIAV